MVFSDGEFNDRVLRQAELDSTEKDGDDEGFSQLLWEALDVEDEFVDHLERQLKTNADLLPSHPENKHASVAESFDTPENNFFDNSGEKEHRKNKPYPHFLLMSKSKRGEQVWQEAWSKLFKQAQKKLTDNEELTIWHIGEFSFFLRKASKQTSKGLDHAVE